MNKEYINDIIYFENKIDIGKAAVLLSMSPNKLEENKIRKYYESLGIKCVMTEVGGSGDLLLKKIINSCVGASLNVGVIEKEPHEIHAVIHATQEACHGLMLHMPLHANLHLKISIVRKDRWICVVMYGNSAYHILSNHSRLGMGYMNI